MTEGKQCYCGSKYNNEVATRTDCGFLCSGRDGDLCGGNLRTTIFIINQKPKPIVVPSGDGEGIFCANEWGTCACKGKVTYGINGKFFTQYNNASTISCTNSVFGDPYWGIVKKCWCVMDRTLVIKKASYGLSCNAKTAVDNRGAQFQKHCSGTTQQLMKLTDAGCLFTKNWYTVDGDPYPGCGKNLEITYTCNGGADKTMTISSEAGFASFTVPCATQAAGGTATTGFVEASHNAIKTPDLVTSSDASGSDDTDHEDLAH